MSNVTLYYANVQRQNSPTQILNGGILDNCIERSHDSPRSFDRQHLNIKGCFNENDGGYSFTPPINLFPLLPTNAMNEYVTLYYANVQRQNSPTQILNGGILDNCIERSHDSPRSFDRQHLNIKGCFNENDGGYSFTPPINLFPVVANKPP
ncbi:hypothetical protein AVEN_33001-1 [Araneus ventricosus]|uniref:Uncharacterized protein n=1 Tax=Araneus ventricosus TaxID=182803 RepID=A0A4Y2MYQ3_ARAVE|nr:hypothetical protein AVEN_33001-1 [Araneus ventricosus]